MYVCTVVMLLFPEVCGVPTCGVRGWGVLCLVLVWLLVDFVYVYVCMYVFVRGRYVCSGYDFQFLS